MKTVAELATEAAARQADTQEKTALALERRVRHEDLMAKSDELKLNHVVQTKLLSDQLTELLNAILTHLESQKPEITKRDYVLGIGQLIENIKKINQTVPAELKSLGKIIDKPKENYWTEARLAKVLKSVQPKPAEIKFPEPPKEVRISDWETVVTYLKKIASRPDPETPRITIPPTPPFPSKITVDNLDGVTKGLDRLTKEVSQTEEEPIGFNFDRDAEGNLATFTEIYPSGTVVSTGWNLGRVKVIDGR